MILTKLHTMTVLFLGQDLPMAFPPLSMIFHLLAFVHALSAPASLCLLKFTIFLIQVSYAALFLPGAPMWLFHGWKFFAGTSNVDPVTFLVFLLWPRVTTAKLQQEYFRLLRLGMLIIFFQTTHPVLLLLMAFAVSFRILMTVPVIFTHDTMVVVHLEIPPFFRERIGVWFKILFLLPCPPFFTALLRYNLHTIKCTCFKCTNQWILVYLQSCVTTTTL